METIQNKKCRMCGGTNFKNVIGFGENPLVNSLLTKEDFGKEETMPLVVRQCQDCFLVQITDIVNAKEIYQDVDYLYYSSDMPQLDAYFREFAKDVQNRFLTRGDFIVEIGSNDGIWLQNFTQGYKILGVDPATNVVVRALKWEIPTISAFFSERLAKSIVKEFGQASVIMGANCIAHLNNLDDLIKGVKTLLKPDGTFIVECNYWGGMVKNKNYSLIYHDHFSYFTLKNWIDFASKYGMTVFDATVTPAQGGSLRVFIKNSSTAKVTGRYKVLLREEIKTNLNSYETCQKYEKEVREEARKLGGLINSLKAQGKKIAGYGAAAKGFSVLKLAGIDQRHIDYFVDDSPAKQGKYTPISHIPVISREEAETHLPDYFFITAPNYAQIIMDKEKSFKEKGGKFILINSEIL